MGLNQPPNLPEFQAADPAPLNDFVFEHAGRLPGGVLGVPYKMKLFSGAESPRSDVSFDLSNYLAEHAGPGDRLKHRPVPTQQGQHRQETAGTAHCLQEPAADRTLAPVVSMLIVQRRWFHRGRFAYDHT